MVDRAGLEPASLNYTTHDHVFELRLNCSLNVPLRRSQGQLSTFKGYVCRLGALTMLSYRSIY